MTMKDHLDVAAEALELAADDTEDADGNDLWLAHQQLAEISQILGVVNAGIVSRMKALVDKAGRPIRVDGGVVRVRPKMKKVWTGRQRLHNTLLNALTTTEDGEVTQDRAYTETVIEEATNLYVTASTPPRGPAVKALGLDLKELYDEEHVGDELYMVEDVPSNPYRKGQYVR